MKRIMAVTAVVLVALLVLGLGFARWFDTLTVHTAVQTGSVDVEFSPPTTWDSEIPEKDFSSIQAVLPPVGSPNAGSLQIRINNAYPSITYTCEFDIDNVGTIPVHITPLMGLMNDYGDPFPGSILWEWFTRDAQGVETPVEFPVQVHPGEKMYGRVNIHMYNRWPLEGDEFIEAQQNHRYEFSIPIDAGQYNEDLVL
jgi:hypothetical protein